MTFIPRRCALFCPSRRVFSLRGTRALIKRLATQLYVYTPRLEACTRTTIYTICMFIRVCISATCIVCCPKHPVYNLRFHPRIRVVSGRRIDRHRCTRLYYYIMRRTHPVGMPCDKSLFRPRNIKSPLSFVEVCITCRMCGGQITVLENTSRNLQGSGRLRARHLSSNFNHQR